MVHSLAEAMIEALQHAHFFSPVGNCLSSFSFKTHSATGYATRHLSRILGNDQILVILRNQHFPEFGRQNDTPLGVYGLIMLSTKHSLIYTSMIHFIPLCSTITTYIVC